MEKIYLQPIIDGSNKENHILATDPGDIVAVVAGGAIVTAYVVDTIIDVGEIAAGIVALVM